MIVIRLVELGRRFCARGCGLAGGVGVVTALGLSASAMGQATTAGLTKPAQPGTTYSYMVTNADSPTQWLWGGPVGNLPGTGVTVKPARAVNFPEVLNSFPGPTVDAIMQQCYGGGFAPAMQAAITNYTFTAATNWNELAYNTPAGVLLSNFTSAYNTSLATKKGMLPHYNDANGTDLYGPSGANYKAAANPKVFEDPSYASPDNAVGGPNNTRDLVTTPGAANIFALLIVPNNTGAGSSRFGTNINRIYKTLVGTLKVPANQICVLYGGSNLNSMTPGSITGAASVPINGKATVANITAASAGTGLFGNVTGQTAPAIPPSFAAGSDLFMYSTGHGNSISVAGGVGRATKAVNKVESPARMAAAFATQQSPGGGTLDITLNTMPSNDFADENGSDASDGTVDLQITSSASDLGGLPVTLDPGTPESFTIPGALTLESLPDTDLSPILDTTNYYDIPVDLDQLNSVLDSGLTPVVEVDGITDSDVDSFGDELASSVTFDDYGDTWTDLVVPEPASLGLMAVGGLALLGRRRRGISGRNG